MTLIQAFGSTISSRPGEEQVKLVQLLAMAIVAIVYGAMAWLLSQYASGIARLLKSRQEIDLETALRAQRSFWRFAGILTLISLILYGVIILLALAVGASSFFR